MYLVAFYGNAMTLWLAVRIAGKLPINKVPVVNKSSTGKGASSSLQQKRLSLRKAIAVATFQSRKA